MTERYRRAAGAFFAKRKIVREHKYPLNFLKGFEGYLHTDGWEAYHKIPNVTVVGCWAHARRKFDDAIKALPEKDRKDTGALRGKRYCDEFLSQRKLRVAGGTWFAIERQLADLSPDERYLRRLELAKPILDDYHKWLTSFGKLGKTLFGNAVRYSLNQWRYLQNYLLDGRLEISNNRSERTVKHFVINRKNFLFANTARGAKASAVMFSIIETALENGLNPFDYLVYIFRNAPNLSIDDNTDNVKLLLPQTAIANLKSINQ